MPIVNGKIVPAYQDVDGFRLPEIFEPETYRETISFVPQSEDIFIVTFPKCGTTWMLQIVYLIMNKGVAPPPEGTLNFIPHLEMMGTDYFDKLPLPRAGKMHLPFQTTPWSDSAKYINVVRNPKDCCVSFYHHTHTIIYDFIGGKFSDFFDLFVNGENDYGDYFDHVLSWYEHRNDPNVLLITYESMKTDITSVIKTIGRFLGGEYETNVNDPEILKNIIHYSSFEYMKSTLNDGLDLWMASVLKNGVDIDLLPMPKSMKHSFKIMKSWENESMAEGNKIKIARKGIIGDWRANFTPEQNEKMNAKIEAKLKGTELLEFWKSIGCL